MIWNKEELIVELSKWKDWDIYELKKKQIKTIRSLAQNDYRWSVVIMIISDWSWDSTLSTHYGLKKMFKLDTTTDLSTWDFKFLIESVRDMFRQEYNVIIPLPRDIAWEDSLYKSLEF